MADSLQSLVKQGGQLFREAGSTTPSIGSKAKEAGLATSTSTPLETAVIGGTPSQAKMAATPAALQGQAAQINLAPTLELATQQRRAQVDPRLTAEQERAQQIAQHMASLNSSLATRVPNLITTAVNNSINGVKVVPQIDDTKLPPDLTSTDKSDLTNALNVLADPTKKADHPKALVTVSKLTKTDLSKMDPTTLDTAIQSYFKPTSSNVTAAVEAATPSSVTLGMLENPGSLGYSSWDSLASDLGIKDEVAADGTTKSAVDVLKGMSIKKLGETVDTLRRTGYQTQQEWMSVLNDPTSSTQDREVARTMLRNMGASGVREAEARMGDLTAQVQASNEVTVNFTGVPTKLTIENVLKSDVLKGAIAILLNPQDPAFKAVSAANPQMLAWVNANKDALVTQMRGVSEEVKAFATQNATNAHILDSIIPDSATREKVGKILFDTWGQVTDKKYDLKGSKLLTSWSTYNPAQQSAIQDAISTIAAGGTAEDVAAFIATTGDNLARLNLFTPAGMSAFKSYWGEQQIVRGLGATTNLDNPNIIAQNLTGMTQDQLTKASNVVSILSGYGFRSSARLPASVQEAIQMAGGAKSMGAILSGSSIPKTVKDAIKQVQADEDAFTNGPDAVMNAIGKAVIKKGGKLEGADVDAIASQFTSSADLRKLQDRTGIALGAKIMLANRAEIQPTLAAAGLPPLNEVYEVAWKNPQQAGRILDVLMSLQSRIDPVLRDEWEDAVRRVKGERDMYDYKQKQYAAFGREGGIL